MRTLYLMEDLGLADYVDRAYYSADLGFKKPAREFFNQVVRRIGFEPRELLFIDNTLENVIAAVNAGWNAFHWNGDSGLSSILR